MKQDLVAVFIHGILGSRTTWEHLLDRLRANDFIKRHVQCLQFSYETPTFSFNPLRRIPSLGDIAQQLKTSIEAHPETRDCRRIVLVGHSMGGLVIQRYIADELRAGRGSELCRIGAVALFATPNTGSQVLLSIRRLTDCLWLLRHQQETVLRPLNDEIEQIRRTILEQAVYAMGSGPSHCRLKFYVYAGSSDGIVTAESARWVFPSARTIPGDHFSLIRPARGEGQRAAAYVALVEILRSARNSLPVSITVCTAEALNQFKPSDVETVVRIQHDRFPAHAHMSHDDFVHWLNHYEESFGLRFGVIVGRLNDEIRGFALFSESPEMIVVGYIAVQRRSGERELLLRHLIFTLRSRARELGDLPIVFEVEDPRSSDSPERAQARIRLFERFGARVVGGCGISHRT